MSGTYDVRSSGTFFQTASRALAMETGRGLSLREFGRLIEVTDIDGKTVLAEFRCGQSIPFSKGK